MRNGWLELLTSSLRSASVLSNASFENTLVILATELEDGPPEKQRVFEETGAARQLPMSGVSVCGLRHGP